MRWGISFGIITERLNLKCTYDRVRGADIRTN